MLTITTVRKNMTGNLLLTPSAQTLATDITVYLPAITEAALKVYPSLLPPCLNEQWHKLAVHGIPTDYFPDMEEGMAKLQYEIENNHSVSLIQLPRYLTHPDKRVGKSASSVMIALRSTTEYNMLKKRKIIILFEQKKVIEYFMARSTDQCRWCQAFGHHHVACTNPAAPTCALCTGRYPTDHHSCEQCPTRRGRTCAHTHYKCTNCNSAGLADTAHTAFSARCPTKASTLCEAWQCSKTAPPPTSTTPEDTTMNAHA
jgi:hypothetical protein